MQVDPDAVLFADRLRWHVQSRVGQSLDVFIFDSAFLNRHCYPHKVEKYLFCFDKSFLAPHESSVPSTRESPELIWMTAFSPESESYWGSCFKYRKRCRRCALELRCGVGAAMSMAFCAAV